MFLDRFNSLYEVHFPLRKIRFNKNIHKKEQFMTKGLLISRQRKLLLSSHLVKHPSADNRRKFKEFRTMYNKLIRAAKKVYFEESLEKKTKAT